MGYIELKTDIPGPKSQELLRRRENAVARGLATNVPIGVVKAEGALVTDEDENRLLDFAAGIGSLNVGHSPKKMMEALKDQLDHYISQAFPVMMFDPYIRLAEKLNSLVPGDFPKKTIFFNSGAEAVENAIKIARRFTNRSGVISFDRAFHGRTFMAMSLTGKVKNFKKGFGSMAGEVYRLPYSYPYRDKLTGKELLKAFDELFQMTVDPEDIASVIMEPIQGDGGFVIPDREFVEGMRDLCTRHGIVLIADEVQTGFARSGKLFAMEHFGTAADLTVTGKSLGGGIPLAGVTGRASVMDAPAVKELGTTLGGNPLACIAGLKMIESIEENHLTERAEEIGRMIRSTLSFSSKYIGEVRGFGAMIGIEFVKNQETKEPYPELVKKIVKNCHKNGVILVTAGTQGNIIRLLPPLVITDDQLMEGLDVIVKTIRQMEFEEVLSPAE